jgi:4-amino-4-deoxy-L-arabinose transferase-like glycosyltransferase
MSQVDSARGSSGTWRGWSFLVTGVAFLAFFLGDQWLAEPLREFRTPLSLDLLRPFSVLGAPEALFAVSSVLLGLHLLFVMPRLSAIAVRLVVAGGVAAAFSYVLGRGFELGVELLGETSPVDNPSTHAAIAFVFAGVLATGAGRMLALAVYLLAALAVLGPALAGSESPSSLVVGAAVGCLVSTWVMRRVRNTGSSESGSDTHVSAQSEEEPLKIRIFLGLLLLLIPSLFLRLGDLGFSDPDEGRYAAIPYEMIQRGDFVTPTLNYLVYFEKPPLLYWTVAGAFKLFGYSEWAARTVPVLSSMIGVLLAFILGRAMFGRRAGRLSAAFLATSPIWLAMGRFLVTDMLFSMLVFSCIVTWWCGHARQGQPRALRDAAFWLLLGLAVLCKGPLAIVLVFGSIGLYALCCRQLKDLFRPGFCALSLVGVAVAAPWFVLVSLQNPGFNYEFWYMQHLGRFLGAEEGGMHSQSAFYFFPVIVELFIPWVLFFPGALAMYRSRFRPVDTLAKRAGVFLTCSCVFLFVFFSASSGKLQIYLLPMLPLMAVALGGLLSGFMGTSEDSGGSSADRDQFRQRGLRSMSRSARVGGVLLVLGAVACVIFGSPALREVEARGPGMMVGVAVVLTAWAAALFGAARSGRFASLFAATAGGAVAFFMALILVGSEVMPNHSLQRLLSYIRPGLEEGGELISYKGWLQSTSYYADRRIVIYKQSGEFHFGLDQLPEEERVLWYGDDLDQVGKLMESNRPVYCLARDHKRALQMIEKLEVPVYEIIWNRRRSIVGNAAAAARTPPIEGGLLGQQRLDFPLP